MKFSNHFSTESHSHLISWLVIMLAFFCCETAEAQSTTAVADSLKTPVRKVLFIGDSMTGWLSERLNAYGRDNGFDVATVVWDGSTIQKWAANAARLSAIVKEQKPDVVFVSLGMNELFEANPQSRLQNSLTKIKGALGETPYIWIGPPSWPGHDKGAVLDEWLSRELGQGSFFSSLKLTLPRQSAKNPHPTKQGMMDWMDSVVRWIPDKAAVYFEKLEAPQNAQMVRGRTFIYKRMKENL